MLRTDYRNICECQQHGRVGLWSSPFTSIRRLSRQARRGSVALLVGVPLAFGAIGFPSDGMSRVVIKGAPVEALVTGGFQIFTTRKVRREFLAPEKAVRTLTLDLAKEEFFRTQVPYGPIIYREARRNALPPELVAAVVGAESDFRAALVSNRNAQGLMQIVPSTGRLLGAGDLMNPDQNISAGTRYLRYLMDRFRDPRIALAAYNAGEGNVEKWGGIPPFPETLAYLSRVNDRARSYRWSIRETYAAGLRSQTSTDR